MEIKKIEISGFKSLDKIELTDWGNFGVLAGANGSGKSNIFDAIKFVSMCITHGLSNTLTTFGGFDYIHCYKKRKEYARTMKFRIAIHEDKDDFDYDLTIKDMDTSPYLVECIKQNGSMLGERKKDNVACIYRDENKYQYPYSPDLSILNVIPANPICRIMGNVRLYRIDPVAAKNSSLLGWNGGFLDVNGQNIAKVLSALERDTVFSEKLTEFMSLVVPGLESITTEQQSLEIRTVLAFKESGLKKRFPAHLISDGTIYLLCLLTAILHPRCQVGITLIEEPERGINPKPIEELISLFRSQATNSNYIYITTHNETVIRSSKAEELVFAYKENGRTKLKWGRDSVDLLGNLPLDTAWLSNMFGSGLPW